MDFQSGTIAPRPREDAIHAIASKRTWTGKNIAQIDPNLSRVVDDLFAQADAGDLPTISTDEGRALYDDLKKITAGLEHSDAAKDESVKATLSKIEEIRGLLEGINKASVDNWWKTGAISIHDGALHLSREVSEKLNDALLERIFKLSQDRKELYGIKVFFLAEYPKLSANAPAIIAKFCTNLDRSCFRDIPTSPRFCDFSFVVGGEELPFNKGLLAHYSPTFFERMVKSGMKESRQEKIDLPEANFQTVRDCLNCLIGGYDIENENNMDRLVELFPQALFLGLWSIADACGLKLMKALKGPINLDAETILNPQELLHNAREIRERFMEYFPILPNCKNAFEELESEVVEIVRSYFKRRASEALKRLGPNPAAHEVIVYELEEDIKALRLIVSELGKLVGAQSRKLQHENIQNEDIRNQIISPDFLNPATSLEYIELKEQLAGPSAASLSLKALFFQKRGEYLKAKVCFDRLIDLFDQALSMKLDSDADIIGWRLFNTMIGLYDLEQPIFLDREKLAAFNPQEQLHAVRETRDRFIKHFQRLPNCKKAFDELEAAIVNKTFTFFNMTAGDEWQKRAGSLGKISLNEAQTNFNLDQYVKCLKLIALELGQLVGEEMRTTQRNNTRFFITDNLQILNPASLLEVLELTEQLYGRTKELIALKDRVRERL